MSFFESYPELSEYKEKIEASQREVLRAKIQPFSEAPLNSRIGGMPFWPEGQEWPKGRRKQRLHFLAQLNFDQLPDFDPYPSKGMVQFFIDPDNDLLGMDYSNRKKGDFVVLYHEDLQQEPTPKADCGRSIEDFDGGPVQEACDLHFETDTEYVPTTDRLFSWKLGVRAYKLADQVEGEERMQEVLNDYNLFTNAAGIKIGGYGSFTQNDIRYSQKYTKYDYLLFQITSQGPIQWGVKGSVHFFIPKQDLKALDFNQVLYTWDDNS